MPQQAPQAHCAGDSAFLRNAAARAALHHPPTKHKREEVTSMIDAAGTPRFNSKSGHTFVATIAIKSPATTARNVTSDFICRGLPARSSNATVKLVWNIFHRRSAIGLRCGSPQLSFSAEVRSARVYH
jgi:hypothetical protein